jgi:hypothetical protein
MPLAAMTPEQITANINIMDPDLLMQLRRHGVNDEWIAALAATTFTTIRKFQMFAESEAGVRESCEVFGYTTTDGLIAFAQVASLKAAWAASRALQVVEEKHRAENAVLGVPNSLKAADYTSTKTAFEKVNGPKEDELLPGVTIIEMMEADLEGGEFNTPQLNEIPSKAEVTSASKNKSDSLGVSISLTSTGAKLSQPVKVKLDMPRTTEEFRYRIDLLFSAIEFIKLRHPAQKSWASSSDQVWTNYIRYILGSEVLGREVNDVNGLIRKVPSWDLVLHYEFKIRSKATKFMNEGSPDSNGARMDFAAALKAASACPALRQREFIEKLQLQNDTTRATPHASYLDLGTARQTGRDRKAKITAAKTAAAAAKKGKGKGTAAAAKTAKDAGAKAKNKKKGAGKGKQGKHNGKQICFAYHNEQCAGNCGREHVCQHCFGKHKNSECTM